MTTENWIALAGVLAVCFGGLYALVRSDIKGQIKEEINSLKQELRDEQLQELKHENKLLRDRVNNTK